MLNRDLAGGAGVVAIGAVYLYFAYQIHTSALDDTLGAGGMPRAYGWVLIALGLAIIAFSAVRSIRLAGTGANGGGWAEPRRKSLWAAGLLGIGIVYLLCVSFIGYGPAIALLLLAASLYQGAGRNWRTVAVAIGGAVALWTIFVLVLGVSMPRGLSGIF